jgi:predicted membrane channel-forming protein YqfA (hemolysin III family)
MHPLVRAVVVAMCGVQALLALGFVFSWPPIVEAWPLAYTNATTFLFIGSILAAAVASTLWCLLNREDAALAGVFLDYAAIFLPVAIFTFQISERNPALRTFSLAAFALAAFGVAMLLYTSRIPFRDLRPTPRLVRWAFGAFVVLLVLAGGQLVLKGPNVLPWYVNLSGQIIYGWMFLGAAAYFAYGIVRPRWQNAGGQLAGFLAYDLVLIVPLVLLLPDVRPEKLPNLIAYLAVLVVSGALATYYLFIHPATRVGRAPKP